MKQIVDLVLLSSLIILFYIAPTLGYGTGAPSVACDSLAPNHNTPPQTSPSPYKIVLDKTNLYLNTPLNITLTSKNGQDEFKGFLVQVRRVEQEGESQNKPSFEGGLFEEDPSSKYIRPLACSNKPNLAMTHKEKSAKKAVSVRWIPKTPGQYRVHTTFVKDYTTFWVNQIDDQIIEVHAQDDQAQSNPESRPSTSANDHGHHDDDMKLCSTMKFNSSVEPQEGGSNPYLLNIGAFKGGHDDNPHKIYQKEWMWINVTSEYGTPIKKVYMQVRHLQGQNNVPLGKFEPVMDPNIGVVSLVNCFGGKGNSILFENPNYKKKSISDVSFIWEAPDNEVGDFTVVASISNDDGFWDRIGDDPEAGKIKVVKNNNGPGEPKPDSKPVSTSAGLAVTATVTKVAYLFAFFLGTILCI